MSQDLEVGQAWVKHELFPRLTQEYRDSLPITEHYGWKTPVEPLRSTFYFAVKDLADVQLIDVPLRLLEEAAHPHNADERRQIEVLLRQKIESARMTVQRAAEENTHGRR